MSLMPLLFSEWLENLDRPHDLFGQHFGLPLQVEDLVDRITPSRSELMIYKPNRLTSNRYHPFLHGLSKKRSKGTSTISANKDNFQVTLDVHHFEPEEINVKVVDKSIVVEAKHEEKQDDHGYISRSFLRRYTVPEQCELDQVESHLSSDGVLTITAPKKQAQLNSNEKVIKIQFTGEPAAAIAPSTSEGDSPSKQQNRPSAQQRGKKSTVKAA